MKKIFYPFFLYFGLTLIACSTSNLNSDITTPKENVTAPKESAGLKNAYMREDLYAEIKAQIPNFPAPGTALQIADEDNLRKLQKSRTVADCDRAKSEVVVTVKSFYGKPYWDLTDQQIQILKPLFDQLRNDGGPYIGQIKKGYSRLRPYEYISDINPCVNKETSFSYPSGHATLAALYSLVLTDLFPNKKLSLKKRSDEIGRDRVLAGVHHPTDILGGNLLGLLLYTEIKKSKAYQDDIQKYKKLL